MVDMSDINNQSINKRHMGLEWLRIVSMLMIIFRHIIDPSGVLEFFYFNE